MRRYFVGVASRIELDGRTPVRGRSYAASLALAADGKRRLSLKRHYRYNVEKMKSIFSALSEPSSSTSYSAYRETTRLRRPSPEEALLDLVELPSPRQSESCRRSAFDQRRRSRSESTSTFGL